MFFMAELKISPGSEKFDIRIAVIVKKKIMPLRESLLSDVKGFYGWHVLEPSGNGGDKDRRRK